MSIIEINSTILQQTKKGLHDGVPFLLGSILGLIYLFSLQLAFS